MSLIFPQQASAFLNAFQLNGVRAECIVPVMGHGRIAPTALSPSSYPDFCFSLRTAYEELSSQAWAIKSDWRGNLWAPLTPPNNWIANITDLEKGALKLVRRMPGQPEFEIHADFCCESKHEIRMFQAGSAVSTTEEESNAFHRFSYSLPTVRPDTEELKTFELGFNRSGVRSLKQYLNLEEDDHLFRVADSLSAFLGLPKKAAFDTCDDRATDDIFRFDLRKVHPKQDIEIQGFVLGCGEDEAFNKEEVRLKLELFLDGTPFTGNLWKKFKWLWRFNEDLAAENARFKGSWIKKIDENYCKRVHERTYRRWLGSRS